MKKYIFVTGGVVSGLGKGITAGFAGQTSQGERSQGGCDRSWIRI